MEPSSAVFEEELERSASSHVEYRLEQSPYRPTVPPIKKSFSLALNKFTDKANTIGQRKPLTGLTFSSSLSLVPLLASQNHPSRLPTPISTASRPSNPIPQTAQKYDEDRILITRNAFDEKRIRKISERFSKLPFFNNENHSPAAHTPSMNASRRSSTTKIQQRGLMAPIQPSSMPRSNTTGNLTQYYNTLSGIPTPLRLPSSVNRSGRRTYVKSPAPELMTRASPHQPAKKDEVKAKSPGPMPAIPRTSHVSAAPRSSLPSQVRILPRSAVFPPQTRLPTPSADRLTPEYDNAIEEERDSRAVYIEPARPASTVTIIHRSPSSISTATDDSDTSPLIRLRTDPPRPCPPPPPGTPPARLPRSRHSLLRFRSLPRSRRRRQPRKSPAAVALSR